MIIKSAEFTVSNTKISKLPLPELPEYAFIGRSNVGKSSLINMLVDVKGLAKTSQKPGKTQLINHFLINKSWYIVDLPGYGYAKRSQTDRRRWEQMIEGYFRKRENLTQIFVLIDSRHGPQKNDLEFISQLDKWGVQFSLVFTKTDKEKPGVVKRNIEAFFETLRTTWQFLPRHFVTSAEKKLGREEILGFIEGCNSEKMS